MNSPKEVRVGPVVYKVVLDHEKLRHEEHRNSSFSWGFTDKISGEILLDPDVNTDRQKQSLVHELLHAVADFAATCDQRLSEEDWITRMAPALLDTLQRNPELVMYLTSWEERK